MNSDSYKVVIIDDEPLAMDVIIHFLRRFQRYEIVKCFTEAIEAFQYLKTHQDVDIIFSDIAMPEISGIELIKLIPNSNFILTTSYSDYAVESFELGVIDYLLKPFSFERFTKAIQQFEARNALHTTATIPTSFFVKEGNDYVKIQVQDIDYIEGLKDYAKIVIGPEFCLALKTLKSIEALLEPHNFMRIHKSYIVPLTKITHYDGKSIRINNHNIPVGSRYRDPLRAYLNAHRF